MSAENRLQAIDVHSHWSTRLGYPLQTEAELAQQERTWQHGFRIAGCTGGKGRAR